MTYCVASSYLDQGESCGTTQQGKYYPTINSSERRKELLFGVRLAFELEHIAIVIELITVKKPLELRKILHLFIIQFT